MTNNLVDSMAKWLASVVENGEPYDGYDKMGWGEFAGGEEMAGTYWELVRPFIEIIKADEREAIFKEIEKDPHSPLLDAMGEDRKQDFLNGYHMARKIINQVILARQAVKGR